MDLELNEEFEKETPWHGSGVAFINVNWINAYGQWHTGSRVVRRNDLYGRRYTVKKSAQGKFMVYLLDCVFQTDLWMSPGLTQAEKLNYRRVRIGMSYVTAYRQNKLYKSLTR